MSALSHRVIAMRRLSYRIKGESDSSFKDFSVCVSEPFVLREGMVDIPVAEGAAGCVVSFDGLPEKEHQVIGGDTLQALELAVGFAESTLKRVSKKFDIYMDGEPYFED